MMRKRFPSFLFAVVIMSTAAAESDPSAPIDPNLQRAQAAMTDLGQSLRGALQQKIAQDGVAAAVAFCHDEAPRIAAEVAARHGVAVGRSSLKHRSPANAPDDWQREVLDGFAARVAAGEDAASVTTRSAAADKLRVARGLKVEAPCLTCHGPKDTIAPDVAKAIAAKYPQDLATGFQLGDLRGLIWAEADLAPAAADTRVAVPMSGVQQQALRAEMRRHFDSVQQVIAALSRQDWPAVAAAARAFAPGHGGGAGAGRGPGGGRGMGQGKGMIYRDALPASWFTLARPMHAAMNAVADEASGAQRVEVALARLAEATAQCSACHATHRIDVASAAVATIP